MSIQFMSHNVSSVHYEDGYVYKEVPIVKYDDKEIYRADQRVYLTINYINPFGENINGFVETYTPSFIFSYRPPNSSSVENISFDGWASYEFMVPYGSTAFSIDVEEGLVRNIVNVEIQHEDYSTHSNDYYVSIPEINITMTVIMDYNVPLSLDAFVGGDFYQGQSPYVDLEVDNEYAWPGEYIQVSATISNLYYGVDHYTVVGVPYQDVYSVDVMGVVGGYFESELSVRAYEEFLSGDIELDESRSVIVLINGIADIGFNH